MSGFSPCYAAADLIHPLLTTLSQAPRSLAQAEEKELHADRFSSASRHDPDNDDADSSSYAETDFSDSDLDRPSAAAGAASARDAPGDEPDAHRRSRAGSIASTYWRPERTDRKNLLTVVDEQCVSGGRLHEHAHTPAQQPSLR